MQRFSKLSSLNFVRVAVSLSLSFSLMQSCASKDDAEMSEAIAPDTSETEGFESSDALELPSLSMDTGSEELSDEMDMSMETMEVSDEDVAPAELESDYSINSLDTETIASEELTSEDSEMPSLVDEEDSMISDNLQYQTDAQDSNELPLMEVYETQTPVASSLTESDNEGRYIVRQGDILGNISMAIYGTSRRWQELARYNDIEDPAKIMPGDVIKFDANDGSAAQYQALSSNESWETTVVNVGDTLGSIAFKVYGTHKNWKLLWRQNEDTVSNPNQLEVGQTLRFKDLNSSPSQNAQLEE